MNSQTLVKSVSNRIRIINGKESSNTIRHLSVNNRDAMFHHDIANALADNLFHNSSSAFSTDAFTSVHQKAEKHNLNFSSENDEVYNRHVSMQGLQCALLRVHDTSAGPDEIHEQLLKHLRKSSFLLLLNIFKSIWISCDFPSDWRKATIIPILKPGKDPTNPTRYHPTALTSYICKTTERMINRRLFWYLKSHNLLTNVQCGVRSGRSTVANFVRFEWFCREAFIHNTLLRCVGFFFFFFKQILLLLLFFYLEKDYDTTWRYGTLKHLYDWSKRSTSFFISNFFLIYIFFKVWMASTFFLRDGCTSVYHPVSNFMFSVLYMSMVFRFATDPRS